MTSKRALPGRGLKIVVAVAVVAAAWHFFPRTPPPIDFSGPVANWPAYGGNQGGERYSPATQITTANVEHLEIAWEHHSGDVSAGSQEVPATTAYEMTPILLDDVMYTCSPFNRVFALDPETGEEIWVHDPEADLSVDYANQLVCRGVAAWTGDSENGDVTCARRISTATADSRLIAIDAATGLPCGDFGNAGEVSLTLGVGDLMWGGEYHMTSPPAVIGDLVVVGSAVNDNWRANAPAGVVRAYDARNGSLVWAWDPAPADYEWPSPEAEVPEGVEYVPGTPNVWAPMSVDEERDLLFLPTGNSAPDYYGGHRNGIDKYGSSVVALRGSSGELVWHFQTVHHDLWDFDVASQPTLTTVMRNGTAIPAVVQATKMGLVFVLNRETGEPLFPVEERPVPQSDVPGERSSPTQPFPTKPPPLVPHQLSADEAWGMTPWDRGGCRERFESLRFEGIYTPPSLEGSLMFPGNAGGTNWGGVAVDPSRQFLVANTLNIAWAVTLYPADEFEARREAGTDAELAPQRGTPYGMQREMLSSSLGIPCNAPPWGTLAAVDLSSGDIAWQVPLGTIRDIAPIPLPIKLGVPNLGGPVVTTSGLVFIGATMDDYIRAFDLSSGEELWKHRLPAGGQATPMTYRLRQDGKQYVVIAAGGHGRAGTKLGDSLVAFALPE